MVATFRSRAWNEQVNIEPKRRHNRKSKINDQFYSLYQYSSQTVGPPTESTSSGVVTYRDSLSGVSLPGWRDNIKKGVSATTQMSAVKYHAEVLDYGNSSWRYRNATNPLDVEGQMDIIRGVHSHALIALSNPIPIEANRVDNQSLSRLYAALQKESQQMSGPNFLGELRETIGTIRRPMRNSFKSLDEYLKRCGSIANVSKRIRTRARRASYVAKAISEAWLECAFGIAPSIGDAKDIAITIARLQYSVPHTVARGYGKGNVVASSSDSILPWFGSRLLLTRNIRYDQKYEVIYRAGLKQTLDAPFSPAARLAALTGFNLKEFIPTVYELCPYSWVLDYFTNCGEMLKAHLATVDNVSWISQTIRNEVVALIDLPVTSTRPDLLIALSGNLHAGKSRITRTVVSRTPTSTLPTPSFQYQIPGIGQAINLGALLVSRATKLTPALRN